MPKYYKRRVKENPSSGISLRSGLFSNVLMKSERSEGQYITFLSFCVQHDQFYLVEIRYRYMVHSILNGVSVLQKLIFEKCVPFMLLLYGNKLL